MLRRIFVACCCFLGTVGAFAPSSRLQTGISVVSRASSSSPNQFNGLRLSSTTTGVRSRVHARPTSTTRVASPTTTTTTSPSSSSSWVLWSSSALRPGDEGPSFGMNQRSDFSEQQQQQQQQQQAYQDPRVRTPATVFGRPLDEATKQANRDLVRLLKTVLFDQVYSLLHTPAVAAEVDNDKDNHHHHFNAATTTTTTAGVVVPKDAALEGSYLRFYALETIARMPYFSYLSVLHLWETLGRWRQAEYLHLHFCETWNELHHLLIVEEVLGDRLQWRHRFVAHHVAFFYYWIAVALYMFNPTLAYNLNQAVEEEAYETYDAFVKQHADFLKTQPAPRVAKDYYNSCADPTVWFVGVPAWYAQLEPTNPSRALFAGMHHNRAITDSAKRNHPASAQDSNASNQCTRQALRCETLYDCFINVRDDELEHARTMAFLQQDDDDVVG